MALFKRHPKGTPYKVVLSHFPLATRDLLPLDLILRWGVLILGFRGEETLNVGVLDMSRKAILAEIEAAIHSRLGEKKRQIRFYRISEEDFQEVLATFYGLAPAPTTARSSVET